MKSIVAEEKHGREKEERRLKKDHKKMKVTKLRQKSGIES